MPEPVASGHTWEEDPEGKMSSGGRTERRWLRSVELPRRRGMFKIPDPDHADPFEMYSLGMERVAYVLYTSLGLRVPATWLEQFEGSDGVIIEMVNGRDLVLARSCVMLMNEVIDEDDWPLIAAADIWFANIDRQERNLMVEPMPVGTEPKYATQCRTWCIDHGWSGLFPAIKFGDQYDGKGPEAISLSTGHMDNVVTRMNMTGEARVRYSMADRLEKTLAGADSRKRADVLDRIRAIEDDHIMDAVMQVPTTYITSSQADKTVEMLKLRRDGLDTLISTYW